LKRQLDKIDDRNDNFEIVEVEFTDEEDFTAPEGRDEW